MAPNEPDQQAATDSPTGLFGTSVTLECIEKKLQEALDTSAKFGPNVSTEQFGYGLGYLSVMVRLKPDWQGEKTDRLPTSFAVKIPSTVTMKLMSQQMNREEKPKDAKSEVAREDLYKAADGILKSAHATEVSFYKLVKKDGLKLHVPQCYLAEHYGPNGENGLLIMEDLGGIATTKPVYETLSVESVKAVLDNLAEVHAHSLLNDQWLFNPDLKMTFAKFQKQSGDSFDIMMLTTFEMLKKDYPALFDPLIDRVHEIYKNNFDMGYFDKLHEELGLPPVLTHGDLWMNNIMWRKADHGKSNNELVAIIDWQLVHPSCIGEDFVRLLCSSAGTDVRREHLDEIIQHYHSSLKMKLGKEPPFTVVQIIDAYKRLFRFGVIMGLALLGGFVRRMGMMGIENVEQRKQDVLARAKCLIDDLYEIEDELALEKA